MKSPMLRCTLRDVAIESLVAGGYVVTAVYTVRCSESRAGAGSSCTVCQAIHEDHLEEIGRITNLVEAGVLLPEIELQFEIDA